ncbi:MAG: hypothetical protein WEB37_12485 [Bacteroidota bacterium]
MTIIHSFKILFLIVLSSGGMVSFASSQALDWSETTFSLTAQWISPQKDFGTYWNNGPAVGAYAGIPLNHPISITALAIVSWHSPAETSRKAKIPQVLLFQLGGGFALSQNLSESLDVSFAVLLVNNAFIMTGPAVRPGFENAVESEFGISFEWTLTMKPESTPPLSFLASYQPIFVGLDPVAIISIGLAVGLE